MGVATLISLDEYLRSSFHPDRDFIEGQVLERNGGKRRHAYAQTEIGAWFRSRKDRLRLQPMTEMRVCVAGNRVRIPDVLVCDCRFPKKKSSRRHRICSLKSCAKRTR